MKRVGAKNAPYFRIVVADSRSPRDGKFIEEIGSYQPLKKGDNFILKLDRAQYWVSKGAQPSATVASFIKKAGKAAAPAATTAAPAVVAPPQPEVKAPAPVPLTIPGTGKKISQLALTIDGKRHEVSVEELA